MWMNEGEIDRAIDLLGSHAPDYLPYAVFLGEWRDIVNQNSDGWPYWKAGSRAAGKLMELLDQAVQATFRSGVDYPDLEAFPKSLTPIKAAATKHGLQRPELKKDVGPAPMRR